MPLLIFAVGITPALWCVVALEASDMFIFSELLGLVYTDALYGYGELAHLLQIDGISSLHIKFHRIEEFAQHQPHIGSLCRAIRLYHCLDLLQRYNTLFHCVGIIPIIVLTALDFVL